SKIDTTSSISDVSREEKWMESPQCCRKLLARAKPGSRLAAMFIFPPTFIFTHPQGTTGSRSKALWDATKFSGVNSMETMQRESCRPEVLGFNPGRSLGIKRFPGCSQGKSTQEYSIKKYLPLMFAALCLVFIAIGSQVAAAQTFVHPGVLVSKAQLDFIKAQVNAHVDPI